MYAMTVLTLLIGTVSHQRLQVRIAGHHSVPGMTSPHLALIRFGGVLGGQMSELT